MIIEIIASVCVVAGLFYFALNLWQSYQLNRLRRKYDPTTDKSRKGNPEREDFGIGEQVVSPTGIKHPEGRELLQDTINPTIPINKSESTRTESIVKRIIERRSRKPKQVIQNEEKPNPIYNESPEDYPALKEVKDGTTETI